MCTIFGRHFEFSDDINNINEKYLKQGSIVTFILWDNRSRPVSSDYVGYLAKKNGFILRTGCCCCVGGCQEALGLTSRDIRINLLLGRTCGSGSQRYSASDVINGKHTGVVRVSFGWNSKDSDIPSFLTFLKENFLNKSNEIGNLRHIENKSIHDTTPLSKMTTTLSSLEDTVGQRVYRSPRILALVIYPIKSCA
eukprot:gene6197-12555_t